MKKSITCPIQSGTVSAQSVTSKVGRSPRWHGRIPASILINLSISDRAARVYGILALKTYQGNISSIGVRQLGELLGISRMSALRAITELITAGAIIPGGAENGKRAWYELTSPVFGAKQRAGVEEVSIGPSGTPRLVSAPKRERSA